MLMLNRVREVGDSKLYEVIDYKHENPTMFAVNTWGRDRFLQSFEEKDRDYLMKDRYLISNAEVANASPFREGTMTIVNNKPTLFLLLVKLLDVGAFFIPEFAWKVNTDFKGENVSHFSNIRVSNSTMFVGFSILSGGQWKTVSILNVDEREELVANRFYFAVPVGTVIGFDMRACARAIVNNTECDVYLFDGSLPVVPVFNPVEYIPKSIINYLFFNQNRFKNSVGFVKLFLDELKIEVEGAEARPPVKHRAVSVIPSIKPTSLVRMTDLLSNYLSVDGSIDEFSEKKKLNVFELMTFTLLSKIPPEVLNDDLITLYSALKEKMNLFALLLMEFRCKIFVSDLVIPSMFEEVIAQGGFNGFYTRIKRSNWGDLRWKILG